MTSVSLVWAAMAELEDECDVGPVLQPGRLRPGLMGWLVGALTTLSSLGQQGSHCPDQEQEVRVGGSGRPCRT